LFDYEPPTASYILSASFLGWPPRSGELAFISSTDNSCRLFLKFIRPSYDEIREDSLKLFNSIRESGWSPDLNIGVGRGGLFVLRCLQDFYAAGGVKIPYVVPAVERYRGIDSTGAIRITRLRREDVEGRKVLVVDDVSDQGDSLKALVEVIGRYGASGIRTATVHFKPWSKLRPDFFVLETDAWIIYPWELYESIRLILEKGAAGTPEEAFAELSKRAGISVREYSAFCHIALDSEALPSALVRRMREVRDLYRGHNREVQKSFNAKKR